MMSELLNNIKRLALFLLRPLSNLLIYSIKLYAWDYAFMKRVMTVRSDEELKNLRSLAIVGVRYQKNYFGIKLKNDVRFQSLNSSLWFGIPCKPIPSLI